MSPEVRQALQERLGSAVTSLQGLAGGDINEAFQATLQDGRAVFVKTNRHAPEGMFSAEAQGLHWLAEARALRVPEVLAVSDAKGAAFLVLELLQPTRRVRDFDERLGQGLAALHRFGAAGFGLHHDNFIGRLAQTNSAEPDWPSFYLQRRLQPQVQQAARRLGGALLQDFERLFARLPELTGPAEPPARLHGDLWGGNLHVDDTGAPCLIDPAVYGGHREMDLAMMRLFGGFSERVFEAYEYAYPLAAGAAERLALYQLYPLLVHVNLFGGGYVGSVRAALSRYL